MKHDADRSTQRAFGRRRWLLALVALGSLVALFYLTLGLRQTAEREWLPVDQIASDAVGDAWAGTPEGWLPLTQGGQTLAELASLRESSSASLPRAQSSSATQDTSVSGSSLQRPCRTGHQRVANGGMCRLSEAAA